MRTLSNRILNRFIIILNHFKYKKKYKEIKYLNEQNKLFKSVNLNRNKGINLYFDLIKKYPFLSSNMSSEHSIIFCALKFSKYKVKNILEIGTYDAKNSFLLSKVFPNSNIDTYDLKHSTKAFKTTYGRDSTKKLKNFLKDRDTILNKKNNISFYEKNSILLSLEIKKKYDLIWLDGAHSFPHVAVDIANSLRLVNKNGLILCDDIIINAAKYDQYTAKDSFITLNEFKLAKMMNFKLFYKRISKEFNAVPKERKYIAFIEKV